MSWFYYFVLATLSLVTISTVIMAIHFKSRIRGMAGMAISMTTGMNVGLTGGVLFGSLFQGNLYYSTILSILTGILAGAASGFALGVLPLLEGFMSGLMGGMMGAMLGEMITQNQSIFMINIFLTLSVSCLLLFQILQKPLGKEPHNLDKKWLLKPILTFLFLTAYLIFGNQLDKEWTPANLNHNNHQLMEQN
ncbi:hypothetical protein CVD25_08745 [Bacillus canaveralius]|uniref:Uncharacterized protein n=1 Tax=Bacillus canaveralius TaxID=1403243 RepID=A0A2N5GL43_9BACI|nr:hypothetical protein [Bacillus canaveralius]PLR82189.1 hypothetical protein CU635_13595 [Bacillus canaveralius]PLR97905.1 hypothetical protein CVD25_08745 [Bacillus canaveralius]